MRTKLVLSTLSLGCGVQSSTIAEMMVEGNLEPVDLALFADTGDEPEYVYDQRDYLKKRLDSVGIPLVTVHKESIIDAIYRSKDRFAPIPAHTKLEGKTAILRRQCTREYKIDPIEKRIKRKLLKEGHAKLTSDNKTRMNMDVYITTTLGISLDESTRMKDNRRSWIKNIWPLVARRMTRLDCINWLKKQGLPIPQKSSCRICPFHSHDHWKWVKENWPQDWEHVIKVDDFLRSEGAHFTASLKADIFLYRGTVPLKDIDFDKPSPQLDFFELCDEGYCFI